MVSIHRRSTIHVVLDTIMDKINTEILYQNRRGGAVSHLDDESTPVEGALLYI